MRYQAEPRPVNVSLRKFRPYEMGTYVRCGSSPEVYADAGAAVSSRP
jgi:hypothetical protein